MFAYLSILLRDYTNAALLPVQYLSDTDSTLKPKIPRKGKRFSCHVCAHGENKQVRLTPTVMSLTNILNINSLFRLHDKTLNSKVSHTHTHTYTKVKSFYKKHAILLLKVQYIYKQEKYMLLLTRQHPVKQQMVKNYSWPCMILIQLYNIKMFNIGYHVN